MPSSKRQPRATRSQDDTNRKGRPKQIPASLSRDALLLDREISTSTQDAFGHRDFAELLQSLIEAPSHRPPFSIGLLGPWGTGKSSIKALYQADLTDDLSKIDAQPRRERVQTVTFNAWRYGGDNIKRALLRHTYLALGGKEATIKDALFSQLQHTVLRPKAWSDLRKEAKERYLWMLGQLLILTVFTLALSMLIRRWFDLDGKWAVLIGAAFSVFTSAVANSSSNVRSLILSRYEEVFRVELPRTSAEEYEDLLLDQLETFSKTYPHCRRLVIFVDDLDRLSAEEMMEGLDAVRTFMELPPGRLPKDLGVVFVISCDEGRVADALGARRNHSTVDLPATVADRMDARRFLDRIFQFRVEVPPFPPQDLRSFAKSRLTEELPDVAADLQQHASGVTVDDVIDRLIHVDVQDPRNALQILNAFAQSWRMARWREHVGVGSSRPGGLQPRAVTDYPEALASLSVLRVNFPGFYAELQNEPNLIEYFTRYFLRRTQEGIPDRAFKVLQEYQNTAESGEDATRSQLRAEFAALRRYMVSLQGLRWPRSLQPLLLLSQDPISRQYGDRARLVLDALVSGDERGVLDAFGHAYDEQPLSLDDTQLLRGLQGSVLHDTEVRRNNAAAAVAGLADRLPDEQARPLLTPVARRLVEVPDLAWRIGLDRVGRMLPRLHNDERQDVAGQLIDQLLSPQDPIAFRTLAGEEPTLDEAVALVETAMPLIMEVLRTHGLPGPSLGQLHDWWKMHTIVASQGRHVVPFSQLETWLATAEHQLLRELGDDYARLAADALEDTSAPDFSVDEALRRSGLVFDRLWEQNRTALWEMLTRFVSLQNEQAMTIARNAMLNHAAAPDSIAISSFLAAFAQRLTKEMEGGAWALESRSPAGEAFLRLIEVRVDDLSDLAWQECRPLAIAWSEVQDTELFAVRLIELLASKQESVAQAVLDQWISRIEYLAPACVGWMGLHFVDRLSDQQRTALAERLREGIGSTNPDDELLSALRTFGDSATSVAAASTQIQQLFQQALQHLQTWYQNPDDYVERVLPAIAPLLPKVPRSLLEPGLSQIFTLVQRQGQFDLLGVLHRTLTGLWPPAEADKDYDPAWYFDQAASLMAQARGTEAGINLLRSMDDMVTRRLVDGDAVPELLEAACELWTNQPEAAADVLVSNPTHLEPEQIAELGRASHTASEQGQEFLYRVWAHEAPLLDEDARLETAKLVLAESARSLAGEPDQLLSVWLDSQGDGVNSLLLALTDADDLNDEQQERVWAQVVRRIEQLTLPQIRSAVVSTLSPDTDERTQRAVFENRQVISNRFESRQERYELGQVLLRALVSSESHEARHALAEWIMESGAEGVLDELDSFEEVGPDHVAVLREHFKNHPALQRLDQRFAAISEA